MGRIKKLDSYVVSYEEGIKLLKVSKDDCLTLLEWYQFIGQGEATLEDIRFHTKIKAAHAIMTKQKDYEFVVITPAEVQIVHQWYIDYCPKALSDKSDLRIDAILTAFDDKYN